MNFNKHDPHTVCVTVFIKQGKVVTLLDMCFFPVPSGQ